MLKDKLKFKLQKTAIILICIALLAFLMQGASYFSRANQHARITQFEELAKTLAEQVAFSLSNYMDDSSKDNVNPHIIANLNHLTHDSRVLDASLYWQDGTQIAHSGENVTVKERLALEGQKSGGSFNHQLVVPIPGQDQPKGFLRLTLDTHQLVTESG
ncbi:AhpA/YtjB family protein, partial [Proteus mirabilis]